MQWIYGRYSFRNQYLFIDQNNQNRNWIINFAFNSKFWSFLVNDIQATLYPLQKNRFMFCIKSCTMFWNEWKINFSIFSFWEIVVQNSQNSLKFLVLEIWSILYSLFLVNWGFRPAVPNRGPRETKSNFGGPWDIEGGHNTICKFRI